MPELSTHLTFLFDPGHGWLRVPLTDIALLELEDQITPYSYIEGQYAYLEEDCDCSRYLAARAAHSGKPDQPEITDEYVERFERPPLCFQDASLDKAFWDRLRR
jgi:hypothetical protein